MLELSTFGSVGGAAGNCRLYPAKAARWDRDRQVSRVYPWSDEWDQNRCNTLEAGPRTTTPVGMYPDGAGPYGCLDMAGNVWEWCQSKYADYPYKSDDGREELSGDLARVVRGGAWDGYRPFARCACRFDFHPDYRSGNIGFRVLVSRAPA